MAFFQAPPRLGNQYLEDRVLRGYLARRFPARALEDLEPTLERLGDRAAGDLWELALEQRKAEPELVQWDPWGNRIDEIRVPSAWKEYARVAVEFGLVATAYEKRYGASDRLAQMALVYLFNPSSSVYTCPLAMTDGAARTLLANAVPELRDRILPHLLSRDPKTAWTSGQWMTERTGGSDVGQTETVARLENGQWRLYGTKWFTSATTSEMALTLARPEGNTTGGRGLAMFLVEQRLPSGAKNYILVNRLKEKLGTRMLPTAELLLDGAIAEPVAGLSDGIRNITPMLNTTRTWNAICSISGMRRCLALLRDYAGRRRAFGALLSEKPLHLDTLAGLQAEFEGAFQMVFRGVELLGREEHRLATEDEQAALRLLQPISKLLTGKQAVSVASECLEGFGGAGYVEDTGLPMLLRDAQTLTIWEGTTNVLSLDALRAISKEDALPPFLEMLRTSAKKATDPGLEKPARAALEAADHAVAWLQAALEKGVPALEAGARRFAMTLGRSMELALLVEQAQWDIDFKKDGHSAAAARRFARNGVDLITEDEELEEARALAMDSELGA